MASAPGDNWAAGEAYERYMGRWSRPLARAFIKWLQPQSSLRWLEIGCGTGALTSAIADSCDPLSIVACDPSGSFIEHARRYNSDVHVSFVVAGADALPRRQGGFDIGVSGLVLNFLPDPVDSVQSVKDRLRPGGIVAAYVWDYAEGMEFLRCFWEEASAVDPLAADLDEGRRFPVCRREALGEIFRAAGLADVETGMLEIPTSFADFEDYWEPFLRGAGPAPSYVVSLSGPGRELLRQRLRRRIRAEADGRILLRARAWAVRGTR